MNYLMICIDIILKIIVSWDPICHISSLDF